MTIKTAVLFRIREAPFAGIPTFEIFASCTIAEIVYLELISWAGAITVCTTSPSS